eukprot:scaffold27087_cov130-Isochrysis_galbana.AAC.3
MHGCGGWLGLVLYIGPGWGCGGGPRRGVGRCGLPQHKGGGGERPRAGPYLPLPSGEVPSLSLSHFRDPLRVSLADALCLSGGILSWSADCVLCEVIFSEVVVERVGEEELSLFVECGEGG